MANSGRSAESAIMWVARVSVKSCAQMVEVARNSMKEMAIFVIASSLRCQIVGEVFSVQIYYKKVKSLLTRRIIFI